MSNEQGGIMPNKPIYKPGEDNHTPGEYIEVGPRGGALSSPRQVTITQGNRLPPTSEAGHRWTPLKNK